MGRVFGMTRGYDGVVHWADGSGKHKGHFKLKDILEFKPVKPGKTKRKWHYFGIVVQEPDTNSLEPCRIYNLCSEASVYHTWKKLIQSTHRHRRNTAQDPFQQRNVVLNLINRFETKHKKRVQVVQTE